MDYVLDDFWIIASIIVCNQDEWESTMFIDHLTET